MKINKYVYWLALIPLWAANSSAQELSIERLAFEQAESAVKMGSLPYLEELILQGLPLDERMATTLLIAAAEGCHVGIADYLLVHGAQINFVQEGKGTALEQALKNSCTDDPEKTQKSIEMGQLLFSFGARASLCNDETRKRAHPVLAKLCTIQLASFPSVYAGEVEALCAGPASGRRKESLSLEEEVDLFILAQNNSPLLYALKGGAERNFLKLIPTLLRRVQKEKNGYQAVWKPLSAACASGNIDAISKVLLNQTDCPHDQKDALEKEAALILKLYREGLHKALYASAEKGPVYLLPRLLKKAQQTMGANQHELLSKPFMIACKLGHLEAVRILLDCGVPADITDNDGNTALMHAVLKQRSQIIGLLFSHPRTHDIRKKLVTQKNNKGMTALMIACGAKPAKKS